MINKEQLKTINFFMIVVSIAMLIITIRSEDWIRVVINFLIIVTNLMAVYNLNTIVKGNDRIEVMTVVIEEQQKIIDELYKILENRK